MGWGWGVTYNGVALLASFFFAIGVHLSLSLSAVCFAVKCLETILQWCQLSWGIADRYLASGFDALPVLHFCWCQGSSDLASSVGVLG